MAKPIRFRLVPTLLLLSVSFHAGLLFGVRAPFKMFGELHDACSMPMLPVGERVWLGPCLVPNPTPNFTMQKGDFPSHQNVGKCMEY
jgi:hypothetical protein